MKFYRNQLKEQAIRNTGVKIKKLVKPDIRNGEIMRLIEFKVYIIIG